MNHLYKKDLLLVVVCFFDRINMVMMKIKLSNINIYTL